MKTVAIEDKKIIEKIKDEYRRRGWIRDLLLFVLTINTGIKLAEQFSKYKVIFKFDDLINSGKKVEKLDRYVKQEGLKVCWGIIGKSLENPDKNYIKFIKENNLKNYHFFNHGYLHLGGSEYEFFNKTKEEQETYIRQTQDIVLKNTGILLNSFGAPCNQIDKNTKLALENIPDIKYWFYGLDFKGYNIQRLIDMENGVGNPDFKYFLNNFKNLKTDKKVLTIQGHPYMWGYKQYLNFKLIIKFLKKIGCEFIFPEDIGENND